MIKDFEGKTEQEAIDSAIEELNLDREEFDVEIVESSKKGFFRKGNVKIRVYIEEDEEEESREYGGDPAPQDEFEEKVIEHLQNIIEKMGYPGKVRVGFRETGKTGLNIESEHSGILIGKKGKNLDALQLLTNIYAGKFDEGRRVIVDAENYRSRHEESIVRMANKTASQVRRSRRSRLLDPMNPFERRLVHTALNEMKDIETKSEGDGMYKQVRIIYRGKAGERRGN